jgi:glyoxylase-like metal-dependent hydrolase (beta-lactamase superfamily II)
MRLSDSLHAIGSDLVNAYLIEDGGAITMVDAGLPGQWNELVAELGTMGRSLDDVKALVLTHGDTDHIGFASRLHRERGVPILVHELDAPRARGEVKKSVPLGKVRIRPFLGFLVYSGPRGGLRVPPVPEVVPIRGGTALDIPGSPRVIDMPGHTPGSVGYHFPGVDAVFVGDAMTTKSVLTGATGPGPAPFTIDQAGAVTSIARLDELQATWVLPGHGPAWDGGVAEAVRLYRAAAGATTGPDLARASS